MTDEEFREFVAKTLVGILVVLIAILIALIGLS